MIEEVLTRLEVREGSDFPRFREHMRTRLETSADGCHPACVCWGLVGSSRYFPAGATGGFTFKRSFRQVDQKK